jgi:hypothetical protein
MSLAVVLDDRHLAAARELREVLAEEKVLAERKAAAKAILAEVLTVIGQDAVDENGEKWATMKAGSARFNAEEAVRNLPPAALKMIVREVPDGKLAKEVLPPALYAKCVKVGEPSIASA